MQYSGDPAAFSAVDMSLYYMPTARMHDLSVTVVLRADLYLD